MSLIEIFKKSRIFPCKFIKNLLFLRKCLIKFSNRHGSSTSINNLELLSLGQLFQSQCRILGEKSTRIHLKASLYDQSFQTAKEFENWG